MIISHTHKFILIKSIKTAGTSVEVGAWGGLLINTQTLATGAPGVVQPR